MYSEKDLEKIKTDISALDMELDFAKSELEKKIKALKEEYAKKKKEILGKKAVLVKKIRRQEFSNSHYEKKDWSNSFCVQHFGKRAKDLTPEERKEYHRLQTKMSREKRKIEKCYYNKDDICVNADSEHLADYCTGYCDSYNKGR